MGLRIFPDKLIHLGERGGGLRISGGMSADAAYQAKALSIGGLIQGLAFTETLGTQVADFSPTGATAQQICIIPSAGFKSVGFAFPGATGYVNAYSAALAAAFNPLEFTFHILIRATAPVWSDGQYHTLFSYEADSSNSILLDKSGAASNTLRVIHSAAGLATKNIGLHTDWTHVTLTGSKSNNRVRLYINGVDQSIALTMSGTWTGVLAPTKTCVGAHAAAQCWIGSMSYFMVYNRELTPSEVTTLASDTPSADSRTYYFCYGDSKTNGQSDDTTTYALGSNGYARYLAADTGYLESPRLAFPGQTVVQCAAHIDADLSGYAFATTPSKIVLNLGVNDVGVTSETNYKTNLAYILDAMHTRWPSAIIYVSLPWRAGNNTEADTMAGWIASVLTTRSWAVVGIDERVTLKGSDNGATYTVDGVHPNHAGHLSYASGLAVLMQA